MPLSKIESASLETAITADSLGVTGNLTFTGTGNRITGDFSNATVASRVMFQTSTVNNPTFLYAIPNGTSQIAAVTAANSSSPDNSSWLDLSVNASEARIRSGINGTGTYLPMTFYTSGSERVRVDTSGNVGIGTSSPQYRLDVIASENAISANLRGRSSDSISVLRFATAANTETAAIDIRPDSAMLFCFGSGRTERMRIDSSGNVGIQVSANLTAKLNFPNSDYGEAINYYSNASETNRSGVGKYASETRHYVSTGDFFSWRTGGPSGTERMRLNSSGTLLLGTATTGLVNTNYGWQLNRDAESFLIGNTPASLLTFNRNNDGDVFKFFRNGSQRGWVSVETTGTTFGTLSDRRAKQNFAASASVLDKISQAQVQSFDWKAGGHTEYGFVAQDLHTVFPFAVTVGDDSEQVEKPWGLDNSKLVPVLVKAIQEQQTLITALTARITALEAK